MRTLFSKLMTALLVLGSLGGLGCGRPYYPPPPPPIDNFYATWSVESVSVGNETCEAAGAAFVYMDIQNLDTNATFSDQFPCNAYQGTSEDLDVGRFNVGMTLTDAANNTMSTVTIGTENESAAGTIDLGHFVFQVTP